MSRIIHIGLLLISAHLCFPQSKLLYEHFDTDDGLPSNFVNAVVQDTLGFLWFLHDNGISRYDGYRFKVYLQDSATLLRLSGNSRQGMLLKDHSGNVCFVNQQSRESEYQLTIFRYDPNQDLFIKYSPDVKSALVSSVKFDSQSTGIWLATAGEGLFFHDIKENRTKNFLNQPSTSTMAHGNRNIIFGIQNQDSSLLLATDLGLWIFNKATKQFKRPVCQPSDSSVLYNSRIVFILATPTKPEYLWLVIVGKEKHHFVKIDRRFSIVHFETHSPIDGEIVEIDRSGSLWFTSNLHGLYRYDPLDSTLIQIVKNPDDKNGLRSNFLRGIVIDRDNNIWITSTDRGISKIRIANPLFYNYSFEAEVTGKTNYEADDTNYLVLTISKTSKFGDNKLLLAELPPEKIGSLQFKEIEIESREGGPANPSQKLYTRVNQLYKGKNTLWIGTWHEGLIGISVDSTSGRIDLGQVERLEPDHNNPFNTLSDWSTTGLWEDSLGNLWVGTLQSGLNKINLNIPYGASGAVTHYRHYEKDSTSISNNMIWWDFLARDKSSFWVVTASGIDLFVNGIFQRFFKSKNAMTIQKYGKGKLAIGTTTGLLESSESQHKHFTKIPSIPLEKYGVFSMQEDLMGRLWITNHHGLTRYDAKRGNSIVFTERDGLEFAGDWIGRTSDGIMITSDPNGITLFDPLTFKTNQIGPQVLFTSLFVNNQQPDIGDPEHSAEFKIRQNITLIDELRLDHQHNNFSLEFSAMEFTAPEKNRYRHKLDGYDNDWIETDANTRSATYTNLNPGRYVFRVKASNHHGIWNDNETTLGVVIVPPPWKTWWAYTLYCILLLAAILYGRRYELRRVRLKQRAEQLAEVDQLKTRFFANISHEFRTPLTLILGPLQDLYNRAHSEQRGLFAMMINNAQRLLTLINQLLDLSKLEAGKMELHCSRLELVSFLREITSSYELLAADRRIQFSFHTDTRSLFLRIDQEKIEKVMHNLLSNALKFTHHGAVVVSLKGADNQFAEITVKDTGIGIPEDQLDKVFDRFYQVDNSQIRTYEGSGLGMALARELVGLHHGEIFVESTFGKGTTFTVWLPDAKEFSYTAPIGSPAAQHRAENPLPDLNLPLATPANDSPLTSAGDAPLLLIVEDNADMRSYIHRTLSGQYNIIDASDGVEGVGKARKAIPDLIISDIMMPGMDGYRLCELIKTDEITSHIPVILLTAKADRQSKLTGLETGADDYLTKPFDAQELKLIIRNRITERRKLRERFGREISLEPKHISINSLDEKFIRKVLDIIETHIDDEHFSIVSLSAEAGYSHIQFYRKIKALSGQPPNLFLKTIRLKRAADLLRTKSDNVAQIAYSVGFSSQSYFIKCFKAQYGVTPGEFTHQEFMNKNQTPEGKNFQ